MSRCPGRLGRAGAVADFLGSPPVASASRGPALVTTAALRPSPATGGTADVAAAGRQEAGVRV